MLAGDAVRLSYVLHSQPEWKLMNAFVVSGLVKRRAELAGDIEKAHESLRAMVLDLENLDATILQFEPDFKVETIRPKAFRPPKDWSNRGQMTRIVLSILRQASEPLSCYLRPELLEVSMIASVAGEIDNGALTNKRPFRSPHHSASMPALVGGGLRARPGEISLAHHGVLFLDEFPEFAPQALDALRQPLETGEVAIARANHRITYPARFMLVAAMNPCRCGRASDPGFACRRGPNVRCAAEYQGRVSGPLLDRIDLNIEVPAVTAADLILPPPAEGSREIAARVAAARAIQAARYEALGLSGVTTNAAAPRSCHGGGGAARRHGPGAPARCRRRHAALRARLPPRAAGGPHARRPRRRGKGRPRASGGGAELSGAHRRSAAGGITHFTNASVNSPS
jgi:hypothetical protein